MKILNLKFKNINSLSGENEIDFTKPEFVNNGLFAITGKTGAGKSSILDAISLALYGKTPRVDITGNENAVMTRGEKDCYAEIIFEAAEKKWKSSWKQERTRTGTLKPINRVIADFEDNIIADQVRSCDSKIVEILKLTFEQFTKVIMLAQGSFAAFLQADKNDKGQLLEQITGTEIYGIISKDIFEKNRTEKGKLDNLTFELETIKILSNEEVEKLQNENIAIEKEKKHIDSELEKIENAKKWLADKERYQIRINETKDKIPELENNTQNANENFNQFEIHLQNIKEEQKKIEPVFNNVRELDTKINEKQKRLAPILKTISEIQNSIQQTSYDIDKQNKNLENIQTNLKKKTIWQADNYKYENLVANYSSIEKENQSLILISTEIEKLKTKITTLQNEFELKTKITNQAKEIFNDIEKKLTDNTNELSKTKIELIKNLEGKELSIYQSDKEIITNFGTQIKNFIDIENEVLSNQKEIDELNKKINQNKKAKNKISNQINIDKVRIQEIKSKIELLEENIQLTRNILRFEEHRTLLQDGEACPLCGALEHPYAKENIPIIGNKENELKNLKTQLFNLEKAEKENENQLIIFDTNNENDTKNQTKEEKLLQENSEKQKQILADIQAIQPDFSIPNSENKKEALNGILNQKRNELKELNIKISLAATYEKQIENLRDSIIPSLQKEKETAYNKQRDAETAQKLIEQDLKTQIELFEKTQQKYQEENTSLLKTLNYYNVEHIESLKKCLDNWIENKTQIETETNQLITIKNEKALKNKEHENQLITLKTQQYDKENIEIEIQSLTYTRKEIFKDKSVDEEEKQLKKLIEEAETQKSKAEKEKNERIQELEKNKAILTQNENYLSSLQKLEITTKEIEQLQTEYNEIKKMSDEFSQKIGANQQTLKSNDDNIKTSGNKIKEKEKQQAIYSKLNQLNDLIGSGDGKKYRNFAQALTFEHLVGLSNTQLKKMTDRYLLKRTNEFANPFELSVIDKYQNSEERTAQNLSGGEKFIISLALALGLANMASKNMPIDTMFIDEGFGTLDSDYLDVALNALSNLQSEGKIIGVISHLSELKERIATHIEIIPIGNGHSKIQIMN